MYSERVLDHFHRPRNVGEIADATAVMKLWVVLREGKVSEAKFKIAGCVPSVACGSWLTEAMIGKPLVDLATITPRQIEAALGGLPPASKHAAVLAADALQRLLGKVPKE
jgi:NifU-like protein involved in Fe-S cluster formation